jgi:OmpA-OmpF porin, OOP family
MQTRQPRFASLTLVLIVLIPAALAAPAALASDTGFYVGLDLGVSQYPDNEEVRAPSGLVLLGSGSSLDHEDTAWGVRAGYQLNRYFAVEAGYLDTGESTGTLASNTPGSSARARFTLSSSGPTLAFVGKWPLGKWEPYLRLGVLFADTDLSFRGIDGTSALAGTVSESTEEMFGGLGIGYRFTERWHAQAEVTFFDDVSTATIGFTYRF